MIWQLPLWWFGLPGILRFTGWDVLEPNTVLAPVRVSDEERQARLNGWAARLRAIECEKPIEVGE